MRPPYSRLGRRLSCSKQPTPTTRTHTSEAPQSRGLFRFRFVVSRRSKKASDEQSSWCVAGWCACARTAAGECVCECGRRIGCVCECVRAAVTFSFFYTLIAATRRRRDRSSSFQRRGFFSPNFEFCGNCYRSRRRSAARKTRGKCEPRKSGSLFSSAAAAPVRTSFFRHDDRPKIGSVLLRSGIGGEEDSRN